MSELRETETMDSTDDTYEVTSIKSTPDAAVETTPLDSAGRELFPENTVIRTEDVSFSYNGGEKNTLRNISVGIPEKEVTAFIGPSGCGKSTLLRCYNRMNDLIPGTCVTNGSISINGKNIYDENVDVIELRKHVGMVFQKSNPFPKSIYDNVAYGLRLSGGYSKSEIDGIVEESLKGSAIWDEVKDRLDSSALGLSGGQQQRLCIARTIAVSPSILLMDEPCSALDPIATAHVEDLIIQLKEKFTIVIVTHNMQQATRVSDNTAFFYLGELIEYDETTKIFQNPSKKETEDYVSGRFG